MSNKRRLLKDVLWYLAGFGLLFTLAYMFLMTLTGCESATPVAPQATISATSPTYPPCDKVGATICKTGKDGLEKCTDPCGNTWTKAELVGTDICICYRNVGGVVDLWPCSCR